jgi:hypothetical protein
MMQLLGACMVVVVAACGGSGTKPSTVANSEGNGPAAWKPATECVDARADAIKRFKEQYKPTDDGWFTDFKPSQTPDIDGDGTPDAVYSVAPATVPSYLVYVTRGTCAHLVASATGSLEIKPTANGWPDLVFTNDSPAEAQGPGTPPIITTLKFDGVAYKPAS